MATFISLINFTEQGIKNVKDSPARAQAFAEMAKKLDIEVKGIYWTVGSYDAVVIADGSDEAVTTALLTVGSAGNVRTQTLRAFDADSMRKILANMP
ncbi:MAG: GYD domain-containing protein [Gammaproteobacteria bacterium]|nr:GYD domain-containing protein [Gammaproteobacteria bacterium]